MRPTSARFPAAIYQSHRSVVEAKVLTPGGRTDIDVLGGSVTLDATADSRGRLDLDLPAELTPERGSDLLAPYGNEIQVSLGIDYGDGTQELVPLGVYRIESADPSHSAGERTLSVTGVDRSIRFIEAPFEAAFLVPAGLNIPDYIGFIAQALFPGCPMQLATTDVVTVAFNVNEGDTPWDLMQVLALSANCGLYFDGDGTLVMRPLPTGNTPAIAAIEEGPGGALLSASRSMSREQAINRVTVSSESSSEEGVVFYGEAKDNDPFSRTHYGGEFGRKTYAYTDTYGLFTSNAACQRAAESLLRRHLGITETIAFDAKVNPALEPYDVVRVTRQELGASETHIIDSVTFPLSGGSMSASTRAIQVVNS